MKQAEKTRPNRRRVVYDAEDIALGIRATFTDRPVELQHEFSFGWPAVMQNVGDSLAVAYASDKWEKKRADGSRRVELYKHLAESRNQALVIPGLLHDEDAPEQPWEALGPLVSLADAPLPKHFAVLGLFEEANLKLYTRGTNERPRFGRRADDGVVRVRVRHGMLGASKLRYNEMPQQRAERELWHDDHPDWQPGDAGGPPDFDQPFIFVYTEDEGVMIIVVGERLDVAKDGIVG